MKRRFYLIFSFLLVLISFTVYAKEPLSYQQVVEFEGMDKNDLYDAVSQTLAKIYSNSKFAIQYQDKDSGTIISNCHEKIKFNFMVMPTDFKKEGDKIIASIIEGIKNKSVDDDW